MDKFQVIDEKDLQAIEGGIEPISIIFGLSAIAFSAFGAGYKFGSDLARRGRQVMNNRNLNLNTLLPKLATILPLLGIGLNLTLHLIRTSSLVSFDWQWSLIGLIAAGYFGIFCKDLKKNNQNYK